jgi:hypothetical protein
MALVWMKEHPTFSKFILMLIESTDFAHMHYFNERLKRWGLREKWEWIPMLEKKIGGSISRCS